MAVRYFGLFSGSGKQSVLTSSMTPMPFWVNTNVLSGPNLDTRGCKAVAVSVAFVVTINCLIGSVSCSLMGLMETKPGGDDVSAPSFTTLIVDPDFSKA